MNDNLLASSRLFLTNVLYVIRNWTVPLNNNKSKKNQIKPNQTKKSNQIKNLTESNQIKPNQKSNLIKNTFF